MRPETETQGLPTLRIFGPMRLHAEAAQERQQILQLFGERAEASVRMAYHLTRDWDAALDLSQEAFVRALETISTLEDPERIVPWFNRIVVNLCRDWLRKRQSTQRLREGLAAQPSVPAADPSQAAEVREEAARTRAALLGLPLEYREALALVAIEGLSPRDAAYALNLPEGSLRWRLHEGRKLLRSALGLPPKKEEEPS